MRRPQVPGSAQRGFTLVEVMITVAILAITASIAMPSLQAMLANSRVRSAANGMVGAVMYARTEAIKRNSSIDLVPVDDEDWSSGWKVQPSGSAEKLRVDAFNGLQVSGLASDKLTISRAGRLEDTVTVNVCDEDGYATRRVVTISFSGMTRVSQGGSCKE